MDIPTVLQNFRNHGFVVSYFETGEEAAAHISSQLKGEVIGFGGSVTTQQLGLYDLLGKNNTVYWHWKNPQDKGRYGEFTVYICSANAASETGELVNIDGSGNRISSTIFGPKKLYYVIGTNKLVPDLAAAIERAQQVSAPKNAVRQKSKTPCAQDGVCHDCNSPARLCLGMFIAMRPMRSFEKTEIVFINQELGY